MPYAYPRCSITIQIVNYVNFKNIQVILMESVPFLLKPITYIIYSSKHYPGMFQTHRTFQRNKNQPEVMAGTSVSTLSKVGSTSSVLETSFNYVWGKSQWILW